MSNTNTQKQKKNVGYRLLAALFIVLSVVALLLPVKVLTGGVRGYFAVEEMSILDAVLKAFKSDFSPFLTESSLLGLVAGISLYAIVAVVLLTVILGLIAIFSGKKAPGLARAICFFMFWGFLAYGLSIVAITSYGAGLEVTFDIIPLALALVAFLFYLILALVKNGKSVWIEVLQFLLCVVYIVAIMLAMTHESEAVSAALADSLLCKVLMLVIVAWAALNLLFGFLRIMNAKGVRGSVARYIISMFFAICCCVVFIICKLDSASYHIFSIAAALVALIQIIIVNLQLKNAQKKALKEKEESVHKTFRVEEYAEAYAYEGGPIAGIVMAKEVNPSELSIDKLPKKAETAGYDFFNCKSFDPFIAMLDGQERREFTELFILRWKGVMPEIPDYVVGGDNEEFFRKLFIYLGQYRDRIPSGLLGKIYQYSTKQMF